MTKHWTRVCPYRKLRFNNYYTLSGIRPVFTVSQGQHTAAVNSSFPSQLSLCVRFICIDPELSPHPLWYIALNRMAVVMTSILPNVIDVMSQQANVTGGDRGCNKRMLAWRRVQGQAAGIVNCKVSMSIIVTCTWPCLALLTLSVWHPLFLCPSWGMQGISVSLNTQVSKVS